LLPLAGLITAYAVIIAAQYKKNSAATGSVAKYPSACAEITRRLSTPDDQAVWAGQTSPTAPAKCGT